MKKILIAAGIGITAFSLFSFKKAVDYKNVIDQLKVSPDGISQPNVSWEVIKLKIRLLLSNTTDIPLDVSTLGFITLKQLYIFDAAGKQLAVLDINKSNIEIPANGAYRTDWLEVQLPLSTALENIVNGLSSDFTSLSYKAKLTITGYGDYIVG